MVIGVLKVFGKFLFESAIGILSFWDLLVQCVALAE